MNNTSLWGGALVLICLLTVSVFFTIQAQRRPAAVSDRYQMPRAVGPLSSTIVSTLVGEVPQREWVDGPGAVATFQGPHDLAVDAQGTVYLADSRVVRKITPAGVVSTLAGEAPGRVARHHGSLVRMEWENYDPRDGRGPAARFSRIRAITVTPDGTVFVSDEGAQTIRRVSPQGDVTTLAGQKDVEGHADGPGSRASFNNPAGVVVDAQGNVFVADCYNHTIRKITPAGLVSTYAGLAEESGHADGPRTQARFNRPASLAFAPDGGLYVHDWSSHTIRRISPQGEVTTWGGTPNNVKPGKGPGAALRFGYHHSLAIDHTGHLYIIQDPSGIRRIRLRDGAEQPYAGTPEGRGHVDAATPTEARFNFPSAVATGPDGSVYVADLQNHAVRKISPQGVVSTLAGRNPDPRFNNPNDRKRFSNPSGVAIDQQGNLYVADGGNSVVRRVSPAGEVSTWAGQHSQHGFADGPAGEAKFDAPANVALGPNGVLYVVDAGSSTLRKITPEGAVSTVAGQPGQPGDRNGPARKAQLAQPNTVAVAPDGTLFVTDRQTGAVRRLSPAGQVSTFVKGWRQGYVGPLSNAARLVPEASAVAVGPDGTVYAYQGALYKYSPAGRAHLLAGDPTADSGFADGTGKQARFNMPGALLVDAQGNVYVADTGNHLIRRVSPQGEVTTVAGDVHYENKDRGYGPEGAPMDNYFGGYRDGPGAQARFNNPRGLALGPDGAIYVADSGNECIRVIREVK